MASSTEAKEALGVVGISWASLPDRGHDFDLRFEAIDCLRQSGGQPSAVGKNFQDFLAEDH
jgi:hypothetical protein